MRLLHWRLASTFPLCFLAGRISYSGCVWFTVYRLSSLGLLLLQHVSEHSLQAWWDDFHILPSLLSTLLSPRQHLYACGHTPNHTIIALPGWVFNVLSRLLVCDFFPPPTCQVFTVSPYQVIKNKIPRLTRRGLTQDYFNGRIHPVFGSTSALISTLLYCVLIYLDVLLYFCMLRLTGVSSCNFLKK